MAYTLKNEAWLCPSATVTVQMEKIGFQASALFQTMCIHTRQYNLLLKTFFNPQISFLTLVGEKIAKIVNVALGHPEYKRWFKVIFSKSIRLQTLWIIKIH